MKGCLPSSVGKPLVKSPDRGRRYVCRIKSRCRESKTKTAVESIHGHAVGHALDLRGDSEA